uniref:Uncharacterized protein n=1 Tax=Solanum tuberosum TaxID=4113 RepID=M1E079_SOLTU
MAIILPKVLVCQALKEKTKLARERSSRRVTEWFCDAVLDRPKLQNLRMRKAKEKGDRIDQRVDRRADRRARLTVLNGPSQHIFGNYKYFFLTFSLVIRLLLNFQF